MNDVAARGKCIREGNRLSRGSTAPQTGDKERDNALRNRPSTWPHGLTKSPFGIVRHGNTNHRRAYGTARTVRVKETEGTTHSLSLIIWC